MALHEVLLGKYEVGEVLGHGTFGEVHRATNLDTGQPIAIKFEKTLSQQRVLFAESEALSNLQGGLGFPKLYAFGTKEDCDYMVTELLGPNLLALFRNCDRGFSLETIGKIATQCVDRVEHMHGRGYLHRDIKPENLLVGYTDREVVYFTDFGLAKKYVNREFGIHIPFKQDKSFTGTLTYASLNTHLGLQQSRRDDLQSLFFVVLFFLKGKLPWQGSSSKEHCVRNKLLLTPSELFKGCPKQFEQAVCYVRALQFEERPNYSYLKGLFVQWNQTTVGMDWMENSEKRRRKTTLSTTHLRFSSKRDLDTAPSLKRSATHHTASLTASETTSRPKSVRFTLPLELSYQSDSEKTVKSKKFPAIDRKKLLKLEQ